MIVAQHTEIPRFARNDPSGQIATLPATLRSRLRLTRDDRILSAILGDIASLTYLYVPPNIFMGIGDSGFARLR